MSDRILSCGCWASQQDHTCKDDFAAEKAELESEQDTDDDLGGPTEMDWAGGLDVVAADREQYDDHRHDYDGDRELPQY